MALRCGERVGPCSRCAGCSWAAPSGHGTSIHQPQEPLSDALGAFPTDPPAEETPSALTPGECAFCSFHVSLCSTSITEFKRSI